MRAPGSSRSHPARSDTPAPAQVLIVYSRSLSRPPLALLPILLVVVVLHAATLGAQERTIQWPSMTVQAHLDADGHLQVKETESIVYNGDWNGGERRFSVSLQQRFDFERIVRVDSASGKDVTMVGGDLDRVDGFDLTDSHTVRWRGRLPSDPPFVNALRVYRLEYSYGNILVPEGDGYRLNHDFAFAERDGTIEAFTLDLTLDPAWGEPPGFTGHFGPVRLDPGFGFVVDVALSYRPAGRPDDVVFGAGIGERLALLSALGVLVILLGARLAQREISLGRLASSVPLDVVTEDWLKERVLAHRAEVIGAAWDEEIGAAEVTAVLARLESEKKLTSRVETKKVLVFTQHVLHMELLVPRDAFKEYERALIDALFNAGQSKTDTNAIRKRYQAKGFTPSTKIEAPLKQLVNRLVPGDVPPKRPRKTLTLLMVGGAVALFVVAGFMQPSDLVLAAIGSGVIFLTYLLALLQAKLWQTRVVRPLPHALRFIIPLAALIVAFGVVVQEDRLRSGLAVLAGLALLIAAAANSVFAMAMWRHGPQRLVLRRELAAARRWFIRELQSRDPKLHDDWFPYLIAFGLGTQMDHWFKAFGGETHRSTAIVAGSSWSSGGSSSSSSAGGWSGFGGGGGFAGGGSSGAWVAAASSVAAGVSAPSSSSSGGGSSSGGSSSGGGGGGGW